METLPSGTVTLLFSDVEGSTRLVRALGDRWPEVLLRQREICREALAAHRGIEFGTEGDSFFVVFATASDAVVAALAAQRAIESAAWPDDGRVRTRIGVTLVHRSVSPRGTPASTCTAAPESVPGPTAVRCWFPSRPLRSSGTNSPMASTSRTSDRTTSRTSPNGCASAPHPTPQRSDPLAQRVVTPMPRAAAPLRAPPRRASRRTRTNAR